MCNVVCGTVYINMPRPGNECSAEMPARAHGKKKAPKSKPRATKKTGAGGKKVAKRHMKANEQTFVYILQSTVEARKSYVGVTNSLPRRLRQHNGQLAGGARFVLSVFPAHVTDTCWPIVTRSLCLLRSIS